MSHPDPARPALPAWLEGLPVYADDGLNGAFLRLPGRPSLREFGPFVKLADLRAAWLRHQQTEIASPHDEAPGEPADSAATPGRLAPVLFQPSAPNGGEIGHFPLADLRAAWQRHQETEPLLAIRRTIELLWAEIPLHRKAQLMSEGFSLDPALAGAASRPQEEKP